jgi:hypothetical protein
MAISIRRIDPVFVGEASGVYLRFASAARDVPTVRQVAA